MAIAATPGFAATTAGPAAETATPAPRPAIHLAPIVSKSHKLTYKGPVYEKTATGEVVPYVPAPASPPATQVSAATGGAPVGAATSASAAANLPEVTATAVTPHPQLLVPGSLARYVNGFAAAPMNAPAAVQQVIWTANEIIGLPYIYGGGHASFSASGYDCSGTVSFALHGGNFLKTPMDSSEF